MSIHLSKYVKYEKLLHMYTGVDQHAQLNALVRADRLQKLIETKGIYSDIIVWVTQDNIQSFYTSGHRVFDDRSYVYI